MKNKVYILMLLLLAFTFMKCEESDFEAFDPSAIPSALFYKTADHAVAAITACYSSVKNYYFHESGCLAFDAMSDDLYYSDFSNPNGTALDAFTHNSANGWVSQVWQKSYRTVSRCNIALEKLPEITMDESLKARLMAEAKFLRAHIYFLLVVTYGDIPFLLKPVDIGVDEELNPSRTPAAQIWTQIEKDLTEAIAVLPTSYAPGDIGRVTKGAAIGYLGKAYLYQKKYPEAAAEFLKVMNLTNVNNSLPNYDLRADYTDNFLGEYEWNDEIVFEINYSKAFEGNTWNEGGTFTIKNRDIGNYGGGWNNERPVQYAVEVHETTDTIRLFQSILGAYKVIAPGDTAGSTFDGKPAYMAAVNGPLTSWAAMGEKNLGLGKYLYHESGRSPHGFPHWGGDVNYPLLRFADILLMYAEALNESSATPPAAAITAFNRVRARALMADYGDYTYNGVYAPVTGDGTKADFRNAIKHERQVEFYGEQIRWFDLVRWGDCEVAFAAANAFQATIPNSLVPVAAFQAPKHYLFPIPDSEMKLNLNLAPNNTGW